MAAFINATSIMLLKQQAGAILTSRYAYKCIDQMVPGCQLTGEFAKDHALSVNPKVISV